MTPEFRDNSQDYWLGLNEMSIYGKHTDASPYFDLLSTRGHSAIEGAETKNEITLVMESDSPDCSTEIKAQSQ